MSKKIAMFLIMLIFIFGASKFSFAMMCGEHSEHQPIAQADTGEHAPAGHEAISETASKESINVGNKICPVSGEKIDEKMKQTYEYEGKIYNFCCASCIDEFKKDPVKYINKIEQQLKNEQEHPSVTVPQHSH